MKRSRRVRMSVAAVFCYNSGMIELSEGQRKTVATGLTVLSLTLVVAFVAITA